MSASPLEPMKKLSWILVFGCTCLLLACSGEALTPEQEIRQFIDKAAEAAENRNADALDELMHRDYLDQKGYSKKQLGKLLRVYFFRNKNIFLLTRISNIEFLADNQARVDLHVAMAASAISDVNALVGLRSQMNRFELQLIKEDVWLLQNARWSPASIADMQ